MAKQINYLTLSYPNFVLGSVIDPEEANQNNADIANKVNEFVDEVKDAMLLVESSDAQSTEALDKANQAIADSASAVSTANTAKSTADNALDVVTSIESDYAILKPELQQAVLDAQTAIDDIEEYIDNTIFTKVGVVVSSGSIVATSDGITSFDIPSDKYNPLYDHIDLYSNGKLLEPTKNYTRSGRTVNLVVGINNNESIYFRAMKNVLIDPMVVDGRNLLNSSIPKSKLEDILSTEISNTSGQVLTPSSRSVSDVKIPVISLANHNKCMVSLHAKGRIVFNLLGNDGDCEYVSKWVNYGSVTNTLDTSNKVIGNNGIKMTLTGGTGGIAKGVTIVDLTKYYCFSAYVKNGNATAVVLAKDASGGGTDIRASYSAVDKFSRLFIKIKPSDMVASNTFTVHATGSSGQYAYADGIMLEEITAEQYNDASFQPSEYVNFVGAYQGTIKTVGKNLYNKFKTLIGQKGDGTNVFAYQNSTDRAVLNIPVRPNTQYVLSYSGIDGLVIIGDKNGAVISNTNWTISSPYSFTTPSGSTYVQILFRKSVNNETITYTLIDSANVQLEEGSVATAYEPYKESVIPQVLPHLRALPNGVCDEITSEGQHIKRVERLVLDGSLPWTISANLTGAKYVEFTHGISPILNNQIIQKYNGKVLTNKLYGNGDVNDKDVSQISATKLSIAIPNTDSGWGDAYTPTVDEIKAYFNGWRMYDSSTYTHNDPNRKYNGTGTKFWNTINNAFNGTGTIPSTQATDNYQPYNLFYQLATPVITDIPKPILSCEKNASIVCDSNVLPIINYTIFDNLKAVVDSSVDALSYVPKAIQQTKDEKLDKVGGTMTGILKAQNNISYTVAQVRNIILSTSDPTANDGQNGDIWIKYKP